MTDLKAGATTAGNGTAERRAHNIVHNGPVGAVVTLVALRILT
ncbi:hypothetical protein [Humibacillus sp. DSM 29435]|nr:hypothetical protein [Humibacillus sp. DSM 29435]